MPNFYLIDLINKDTPNDIDLDFTHIKCKADGSKLLILSSYLIESVYAQLKTLEEAQEIHNSWIAEENVDPPIDELGNPIMQRNLNLSLLVQNG